MMLKVRRVHTSKTRVSGRGKETKQCRRKELRNDAYCWMHTYVQNPVFSRIAIDQRVFVSFFSLRKGPPHALPCLFAAAAVAVAARPLSYGAPRRSDLTIINDAIKVTTLIFSRYTPCVKRTDWR